MSATTTAATAASGSPPGPVAVLMVVVLWYYPQAARLPYASHAGYLTTLGILGVGVASETWGPAGARVRRPASQPRSSSSSQ